MFKNVHKVFYNCAENKRDGLTFFSTSESFNSELQARVQNEINDDNPVVIINHKALLPPHWEPRLLQPLQEDPTIELISALNVSDHQLSPITKDFNGSLAALDNCAYLLQAPRYFQSKAINQHCFAVRNIACLENHAERYVCNNLVVDVPQETESVGAPNPPSIGDQNPLPAHPLATLQLMLDANPVLPKAFEYPVLDTKPVALHVVMDWGGGVHQWVNEFIKNHNDFHHLVLVSHGEFFRAQHGEQYSLHWQDTQGLCIEQHHLTAPISSTAIHHAQYNQILASITNRWQVNLVVVSSLIGHAMDCLNTGLPTLRMLHDYFPHWPLLNAQLDAPNISQQDIQTALDETTNEPFGRINATQLKQWQSSQNQLLKQKNVVVVAPDVSVKDNLLKLPEADVFAETTIIPHFSNNLTPIKYLATSEPFTVLVLGRISKPKGEDLIKACIEGLQQQKQLRFVLLGAGVKGKDFIGFPNTQVIENYLNAELNQIVSEISPQLALLASSASETFSYTLSELQAMGVPTLATNRGAFKNRINDGVDGFLIEPQVKQVTEKIIALTNNPEILQQISQAAVKVHHSSSSEHKKAFEKIISLGHANHQYTTFGLVSPKPLAKQLKTSEVSRNRLELALQASIENLKEKTDWAQNLSAQIQHLEKNITLEREHIDNLKKTISDHASEYNQKIDELESQAETLNHHINKLNAEINELSEIRNQIVAEKAAIEARFHTAQQHLTATLNSRSWRFTRPLRRFTTYARHKRNALRFRYTQLKGLPKRIINSLRSRGLKQTTLIAKNKLKKPTTPTVQHAQELVDVYEKIVIKNNSKPSVSIIIPVYNQFKHTYHCLNSIAQLTDTTPFEVIVIDDCSDDQTESTIHKVAGITYHRQTVNGGFIESCNTGATLAQGNYLVFLNNDTEVLEGWLDELVNTFDEQADAGLVGSQLLYPDGRLQEAGGIVFSDGSGWNYGRLENPDAPEYQHLREATYISGASIMIKKKLFDQLGQFDQRYKPAYYEDTDLAFAVRHIGLKVYYQPLSRVIHFEGISSGTDLTSGTKRYQVINQQKFLDKWHQQLQNQPAPGTDIELARFQNKPARVLIFDACTPTPDQDSGSLRMLNLMKIFIELGHQVTFVPENMAHFKNYTENLQRMGIKCVYAPRYNSPVDYLQSNGSYYDTVILSRYYVAEPLMSMMRDYCPKAKIWFDTVDLHYLRETRMAELANDAAALKAAQTTKTKELSVADGCDLTLVVSPYEQDVLATEAPSLKVNVLSNIHEIFGGHTGFDESEDLLFIGGYQHTPNVDGLLWFVDQIFPQVVTAIPAIKLHVVGSKAPPEIIALGEHPNIEFHGFVENIEPMMRNIRIAVAPLRFGAGVKGKVNMSMSYGQPVVGTKVAVEGMYTTHRQDVMMADESLEFAAAIVELYEDAALWQQVSKGGLKNVENWFSFNAAKNVINEIISQQ